MHRHEVGEMSKIGEQDESLLIRRGWISRCRMAHLRGMRKEGAIFPFDLVLMRKAFMGACGGTSLMKLKPVVHMGRDSGASVDRSNGVQLLDVQRRGRWRCMASVRRYEKSALLQKTTAALTGPELKSALRAEAQLPTELCAAFGLGT
jgi:hypothetical protein